MRSNDLKAKDLLSVFQVSPQRLINYMLRKELLETQVEMLEAERKQLVESLYESEKKITQLSFLGQQNTTFVPEIYRLRKINFILMATLLILMSVVFYFIVVNN